MRPMRLSDAYEALTEYGVDARAITDVTELLVAFQPLKLRYKEGSAEEQRIYNELLRPALVVIRSHVQQVHRKAFGPEASKVAMPVFRPEDG